MELEFELETATKHSCPSVFRPFRLEQTTFVSKEKCCGELQVLPPRFVTGESTFIHFLLPPSNCLAHLFPLPVRPRPPSLARPHHPISFPAAAGTTETNGIQAVERRASESGCGLKARRKRRRREGGRKAVLEATSLLRDVVRIKAGGDDIQSQGLGHGGTDGQRRWEVRKPRKCEQCVGMRKTH